MTDLRNSPRSHLLRSAQALAAESPRLEFGPGPEIQSRGGGRIAPIESEPCGELHRSLRAATRSDHDMVDRLMLRLDLSRREDYGLFLHIHYSTFKNLDTHWREEDNADFAGMIDCLQNDIRALGVASSESSGRVSTALLVCNHLGVAYVIRGSRLGAAFLRRRVPREFPTSYLDFVPSLPWGQFLKQLEPAPDDPKRNTSEETIQGARITFEIFAALLKRALA